MAGVASSSGVLAGGRGKVQLPHICQRRQIWGTREDGRYPAVHGSDGAGDFCLRLVVEAGREIKEVEGDAVGGMAGELGGVEVIAEDGSDAEGADFIEIVVQGLGVVLGVVGAEFGGDGGGVEHGVVEDLATSVVKDGLDVLRGGKSGALVGLGHQVADIDAQGLGTADGFGDSAAPGGWECNW